MKTPLDRITDLSRGIVSNTVYKNRKKSAKQTNQYRQG